MAVKTTAVRVGSKPTRVGTHGGTHASKIELDGEAAWMMAWELVHRGLTLDSGEQEIKVNGIRYFLKRSGEVIQLEDV